MPSPRFVRVTEYRATLYSRTWRGSVLNSFANPVLYLLAMGIGVGRLVDANDPVSLAGVDYVTFLAPGLLAGTAMNVGVSEATYPVLTSVKWFPTAFGQIATPVGPKDMALGNLAWIAVRIVWAAVVFVAVMVVFGAADSVWVVAGVPASLLTGMAFAGPLMAWSVTLDSDYAFPPLLRFVIMPMFLFSGTFFPVDQLPAAIRPIAWITPLWHGVRLCRSLALGEAVLWEALGHAAVLTLIATAGTVAAMRNYGRRLMV
jgi:lipooligosaccharide transport system permease protein